MTPDELTSETTVLGKTVFAASGDKGSMGNADESDGRSHVSYPASDSWVTAVGGTTINNVSGSSFDEITWNDNGVTGGGISIAFPLPSWQVGVGVPPSINDGTTVGRGVPDVAGYSNGYEISLYGEDGGSWWGTSEASPLYAAMVATASLPPTDLRTDRSERPLPQREQPTCDRTRRCPSSTPNCRG